MRHSDGVSCDIIMTDARGQLAVGVPHIGQKNARRLPTAEGAQARNESA